MNIKSATSAINKSGAILVFPINNKKEPASLWEHFFPGKKMKWEWNSADESGLTDLWNLKTKLSTTQKVVYTKWYQDKATYFSRNLFAAMLRGLNPELSSHGSGKLNGTAKNILEILESDSPVSSKELKKMVERKGRAETTSFNHAMKELWSRMLIVAFGEIEDGSFPSLAIGSTQVLFEGLWAKAWKMSDSDAKKVISKVLGENNPFRLHYEKLRKRGGI